MNWRERFGAAYIKFHSIKSPNAMATGYFRPKFPALKTANGLATLICDFCKFMGHDMHRNNTTGRYREGKKHKSKIYAGGFIQEKGIWLKSEKGRGHADVKGSIKGRAVSFEIKIGDDKPSEKQLERQEKARADSAIYEFVKTPEDFFTIYDKIINNEL